MSLPGYPDLGNLDLGDLDESPELTATERLISACESRAWTVNDGNVDVEGWDPEDGQALAVFAGVDGAILRIWRTVTDVARLLRIKDGTDIGPQIVAAVKIGESHATNPSETGPVTWGLLASHPSRQIVDRVARCEDTPSPVLARLNKHPWLGMALARNPATPPRTLTALAGHANPEVRAAVAGNLAVPVETLNRLRTEPNRSVRDAALETIERLR